MFRSNKINMVIAIVVAVLLWMYVVGQVNPTTTKKFAEVPITFVGEENLSENGLAVAEIESTQLAVTLEGNRAVLMKTDPKDIRITADLSSLGKGKNAVPVKVEAPDNTALYKTSAETVNVTVEDRVVESKPIKVKFKGSFKEGSEPGQIRTSPETIEVSGARSTVDRVAHIQTEVDGNQAKEGRIETDVKGFPVDAGGDKVGHVQLSQDEIHVSAVVMGKKTVDLTVETVGEVPPGHLLDSVEVPQKITIKGPKDVLKDIREVTADPVNIAGLTETARIPLKITLPGGAEVAEESMGILVVVSIKGLGASKLTFSSKEIKINNLKEGLQVHVNDEEISVIAKSKNGNTTNLSLRDVNPYIEGKGLEPGTRKVKIMSAPSKGVESVVFSPDEVEITISEV